MNDLAVRPYNVLGFCAGVGGLELGIQIARPGAHGVCYIEREAHAAEVLAARMEDGSISPAPIWSDAGTFDPDPWRGLVDCVASGDPCQPNSVAGGMRGADDDRWLIDQLIRIVEGVRPARLFRENVCGNADGQLAAIVPALESLGYRVAAGIFSAEEVGFSHRRERLFIMADHSQLGSQGLGSERAPTERTQPRRPVGLCDGTVLADDADAERGRGKRGAQEGTRARGIWRRGPSSGGVAVGHAGRGGAREGCRDDGEGSEISSGEGAEHGPAVHRGAGGTVLGAVGNPDGSPDEREAPGADGGPQRRTAADGSGAGLIEWLPLAAPGPADPRWRDIIGHAPHLEPAVRRVDARLAYRVDRLRECGNGVSSLAAAVAWRALDSLLHSVD